MDVHVEAFTLSMSRGQADPTSDYLTAFNDPRSHPGTSFYGIIDLGGQLLAKQAGRAQAVLQKRLRESKGALTSALSRAVEEARLEAIKGLVAGTAHKRPLGAAVAVALRGGELYVAGSGTATLMWRDRYEFHCPEIAAGAEMSWLDRVALEPGDALVIGNAALAEVMGLQDWEQLLGWEPDEAARRVYYLAQEAHQVSALFVKARPGPDGTKQ